MAIQFATLTETAADCDVIVGANASQFAAPSIAEQRGIPYIHVSYRPRSLPSPHHAPLPMPRTPPTDSDNDTLWAQDDLRAPR